MQGSWCRVQGLGFRAQSLGIRVPRPGRRRPCQARAQAQQRATPPLASRPLGLSVQGAGFGVNGLRVVSRWCMHSTCGADGLSSGVLV